jgi:thioredoxin 1
MADPLITVTDSDFKQTVLEASKLVLVDFWADWCMPCRFVTPLLEELATDYEDVLIIAKLNVDENGDTAADYGITSIPSLMLFKDGERIDGVIGAVPKEHLVDMIKKHL